MALASRPDRTEVIIVVIVRLLLLLFALSLCSDGSKTAGDASTQTSRGRKVIPGVLTAALGDVNATRCEDHVDLAAMVQRCLQLDQGLCVSRIVPESVDHTDPVACCCPFKPFAGSLSAETAVLDAPQGMCSCGRTPLQRKVADTTMVAAFSAGWTFDFHTEWVVKDRGYGADDFAIYNSNDNIVMKCHATGGLFKFHDRWNIVDAEGHPLMTIAEKGESAMYKHYEVMNPDGKIIATIRVSALAMRTELYMYTGDPVFNWRNRPVDEDTQVLMTIRSNSAFANGNVDVYEGDYETRIVNASDELPWSFNTSLGGHNEYNIQVAAGKPVKLVVAAMIVYDEVVEDMNDVCVTQSS